ncbi:MAG: von Willebrand factor type A domain-containing protein, partial [Pseudobdellovibrionaceae bacterium]
MAFENKKLIYGGLATACVAILAVTVAYGPMTQQSGDLAPTTQLAVQGQVAPQSDQAPEMEIALQDLNKVQRERGEADASSFIPAPVPAPVGAPPVAAMKMQMAEQNYVAGRAASIAAEPSIMPYPMPVPVDAYVEMEADHNQYKNEDASPIKVVAQDPVSTFSIDVDTSSYAMVRRSLNAGRLPVSDAVRIEEMINYFPYDYQGPTDKAEPFKANVTVTPSPWATGKKLVHIGIKGYDIGETRPHANLVFLLDVSGSMSAPDKLPLVKQSMEVLLTTLKPDDTVSIVTYAGGTGVALEPTKVKDKAKIIGAMDALGAGGGTAGAQGIEAAYVLAEQNYSDEAVNRVILATDGDFNIGVSDPEALKKLIEKKRDSGIFLSVLGFGQGNVNDHIMQELAQNGNGVAAYIDSAAEARKVLVDEATSQLFPIAKDVKVQVEFNPETVAEYRLVGYETRALKNEDFNNDKVDAGDIGAGHTVTAIYEVTPKGSQAVANDPSRYTKAAAPAKVEDSSDFDDELAFLKIRYKLPNENTSKLITTPIKASSEEELSAEEDDVRFSVAVASFGQLLKDSKYVEDMDFDDVIDMAQKAKG